MTKTSSSESSDDVVVDTRFKASGSRPPATNSKSRSRARCSAGNSSTRPLPSLGRRGRSGRGVVAADTRTGDGGDALRPLVLAMGSGACVWLPRGANGFKKCLGPQPEWGGCSGRAGGVCTSGCVARGGPAHQQCRRASRASPPQAPSVPQFWRPVRLWWWRALARRGERPLSPGARFSNFRLCEELGIG